MAVFLKYFVVPLVLVQSAVGFQFRFDVPDNEQECFGQALDVDTQVSVDYRVFNGFYFITQSFQRRANDRVNNFDFSLLTKGHERRQLGY